jgi:hypothetical protein
MEEEESSNNEDDANDMSSSVHQDPDEVASPRMSIAALGASITEEDSELTRIHEDSLRVLIKNVMKTTNSSQLSIAKFVEQNCGEKIGQTSVSGRCIFVCILCRY